MDDDELIRRLIDLKDDVERRARASVIEARDRWTAVAGHLEYAIDRAKAPF